MSTPRVIGGKAKGLRLQDVPGDTTRPVTDRVKESLFNIIGADIVESSLFDLFGGTGSIGIEALSRGASFVRFIDNAPAAILAIKANLKHTHLVERSEVIQSDSLSFLSRQPDRSFEYIYIAPPQYKNMWLQTMNRLDQNPNWLTDDGWIIVQIHPIEYQPTPFTNFTEFDQRKYGSTILIFYQTTY